MQDPDQSHPYNHTLIKTFAKKVQSLWLPFFKLSLICLPVVLLIYALFFQDDFDTPEYWILYGIPAAIP